MPEKQVRECQRERGMPQGQQIQEAWRCLFSHTNHSGNAKKSPLNNVERRGRKAVEKKQISSNEGEQAATGCFMHVASHINDSNINTYKAKWQEGCKTRGKSNAQNCWTNKLSAVYKNKCLHILIYIICIHI